LITSQKAFDIYSIGELYDMTDLNIEAVDDDIEYKEENDFLNRNNYRTEDNTFCSDYNCGGYALNTYNWYKPYEGAFEWREQLIYEWLDEYYDENGLICSPQEAMREVENRLLLRDALYMMRQFKGRLRRISSVEDLWADERLIAYRIGIKYDFDEVDETFSCIDIDFHYRFCYANSEDAIWFEKMGGGGIGVAAKDLFDDEWVYPFWTYTSDVILFALQD
jgi:hypothetical protein